MIVANRIIRYIYYNYLPVDYITVTISTGSATAGLPGIGSPTDKQSATITLAAASLDGTVAEGIKAANHSI